MQEHLLPGLRPLFARYPALRSACLLVAQYPYLDTDDAVHALVVVSELETPALSHVRPAYDEDQDDPINLPTLGTISARDYELAFMPSLVFLSDLRIRWDSEGEEIGLWAAYTVGGGREDDDGLEGYTPAVTVTRRGDDLEARMAPISRPWLDGVRPPSDSGAAT